MRIRLVTHPPLPPLRSWFGISTASHSQSISSLKSIIYTQVLQSKLPLDFIEPSDLLLEMEGFELLGENICDDVLQNGDLVEIKANVKSIAPINTESTKRKLQPDEASMPNSRPKKKTKTSPTKETIITSGNGDLRTRIEPPPPSLSDVSKSASSSEPDEDSSSSESDSSSDSDSEEDSEESDSSDSSSSSSDSDEDVSSSSDSTSSGPSVESSKKLAPSNNSPLSLRLRVQGQKAVSQDNAGPKRITAIPERPSVPPGQGKTSTQERNARRRKGKQATRQTLQEQSATLPGASHFSSEPSNVVITNGNANLPDEELPYGTPPPSNNSNTVTVPAPSNGHDDMRETMMHLRNSNKKKGFKSTLHARQNINGKITFEDQPSDPASTNQRPRATNARLIPPSERTDLPSNVFVTSVDVEAGLWDGVQAFPLDKNKRAALVLKNLAKQAASSGGDKKQSNGVSQKFSRDWKSPAARQHAEKNFDQLAQVGNALLPGAIVAWKALAIDPQNLTPQLTLHLGKVLTLKDGTVTVSVLNQPHAELSFGKHLIDEMADQQHTSDELIEEETSFAVEETGTWKLFQDV